MMQNTQFVKCKIFWYLIQSRICAGMTTRPMTFLLCPHIFQFYCSLCGVAFVSQQSAIYLITAICNLFDHSNLFDHKHSGLAAAVSFNAYSVSRLRRQCDNARELF
jgi:hypothetical protein